MADREGLGNLPIFDTEIRTSRELVAQEQRQEDDYQYIIRMYPALAREILDQIEDACDQMEYDGSRMFDEYMDRTMFLSMADKIYDKMNYQEKEECPKQERMLHQMIVILIGGEIYHGRAGFAGEFGHMTINFAGPRCGCGGSGCFELYASGTAVNQRMKRDIRSGIKSAAFESIDYDPEKVNGKILSDAAAEGDAYAIDMLRQEGYYIGVGLSNLINLLDPDVIVLAGGMAKADKYFRYSMMNEIRRHACFPFDEDRIRVSELNDKVVAYGAYVMVKKAIDGSL